MQRLGTDHSLPAQRTSCVAGTVWCETSPSSASSSRREGAGPSASFSLRNSSSGGAPVVAFGSSLLLSWILAIAASIPYQPSKSPS